jgi:hypothetical protein
MVVGGHGTVKQLLEATTSEDDAVRNVMAGSRTPQYNLIIISRLRHVDIIRVARHLNSGAKTVTNPTTAFSHATRRSQSLIMTLDILGHNGCWIMEGNLKKSQAVYKAIT